MRHYSLYEFAFKPKIDLVLRTDVIMNVAFNAALTNLKDMVEVDRAQADSFKAMLGSSERPQSSG